MKLSTSFRPLEIIPFDRVIGWSLLLTGAWIYARTLTYPFISFDDPGYVVNNAHVNAGLTWSGWKWAWTSLEQSNWHPLTWLSLMLDAQLYGLRAGGYHLTNLVLHVLNAMLLFRWLRSHNSEAWPAALTAFFFVAHPLHVESVAWVTERKDVLSTLFFFLTLLAYSRYARNGNRWTYVLALGWFALGLTAKPMLVTLPPLLILVDRWPLDRWGKVPPTRLLAEKVPFGVLAILSCVVTFVAQREKAMVPIGYLSLVDRWASAALGYGTYLKETLLPWNLGVYYPFRRSPTMLWPAVWTLALLATVLGAWRLGRRWPFLPVGIGWFLGMLVPVIGVVQVGGQAVADRYTYLPHIGLFIAVFWSGAACWRRWVGMRIPLAAATLGAAIACVVLSSQQTSYWRSSAALFEHTAQVVKPSGRVFHLLGDAWMEEKQPAKATTAYLQAWRLGGLNSSETILPVSAMLISAGRWSEALQMLSPWRDRSDATPGLLNNLALVLAKNGRGDEALSIYRSCAERFPKFALAHFGMAELLQAQGRWEEASAQDAAGLTLQPDWLPALNRLAWNYTHSDDLPTHESAQAIAQQAVRLTQGRDASSLSVLAYTQAVNGHWEEAADTAAHALEIVTGSAEAEGKVGYLRRCLECYRRKELPL